MVTAGMPLNSKSERTQDETPMLVNTYHWPISSSCMTTKVILILWMNVWANDLQGFQTMQTTYIFEIFSNFVPNITTGVGTFHRYPLCCGFAYPMSYCTHMSIMITMKKHTWRPTGIFLVNAPSGNIVWTWGTTVELSIPPSKPIVWFSWRTRVTIAKYMGKSVVRMRVIRLATSSSSWSNSGKKNFFNDN